MIYNQRGARSAEFVMIISYPASPSRIIVLLKTLRHKVDKLKKKVKVRENRKKGIIFRANARKPKGARKPFDVLQRFQSKLNESNLASRGERKGFALEKSAEFIGSKLL